MILYWGELNFFLSLSLSLYIYIYIYIYLSLRCLRRKDYSESYNSLNIYINTEWIQWALNLFGLAWNLNKMDLSLKAKVNLKKKYRILKNFPILLQLYIPWLGSGRMLLYLFVTQSKMTDIILPSLTIQDLF